MMAAHSIEITGPDAVAFAHAQFASPVSSLLVGHWQFSAWLDARGRVQALFHLVRPDEHTLILVLRHGNSDAIAAALRRFVFRSRVSIEAKPAAALRGAEAQALHTAIRRPDALILGCGGHSLCVGAAGRDDPAWRLLQIRAGWPWLPDAQLGQWLPPALSLQRLQAVVTDKGCYPGQEIVARLHFRGVHKQHLCRLFTTHPLRADEPLRSNGNDAGRILDTVVTDPGTEMLAILDNAAFSTLQSGRPDVFTSISDMHLLESWPA